MPSTPPPPAPELPPAPVDAAPPPTPEQQQSAIARYTGMVRNIVESHLIVPRQLQDDGLEGTCTLRFTLAPDGTLLSVSFETPSGMQQVDDAALAALRNSHLPPFIGDMPKQDETFTLPVLVSGEDQ